MPLVPAESCIYNLQNGSQLQDVMRAEPAAAGKNSVLWEVVRSPKKLKGV
jgi:hypothetical protein